MWGSRRARAARSGRAVAAALVSPGLVLVAACSDDDAFDRDAVVAEVAATQGWTEKEAGCWVDRVREELGEDELARARERPVADPVFAPITVDCVAADKLASSGEETAPVTALPDDPVTYGDDPALDVLWDACAAGDGAACDRLFDEAPVGSEYERFGNTCGDRGYAPSCAG